MHLSRYLRPVVREEMVIPANAGEFLISERGKHLCQPLIVGHRSPVYIRRVRTHLASPCGSRLSKTAWSTKFEDPA
jgi:hypothetical protein